MIAITTSNSIRVNPRAQSVPARVRPEDELHDRPWTELVAAFFPRKNRADLLFIELRTYGITITYSRKAPDPRPALFWYQSAYYVAGGRKNASHLDKSIKSSWFGGGAID